MRRPQLNLLIDVLAFAAFAALTATGVLMHFTLPAGTGHSANVLGLNRHGWGEIHFWTACTLFALLCVHLILHWQWIVAMVRGRKAEAAGRRIALGLLALAALLGLLAAPFFIAEQNDGSRTPVESNTAPGRRARHSP